MKTLLFSRPLYLPTRLHEVVLIHRRVPISSDTPAIMFGSMPNDGGHFLLTASEKSTLIEKEPRSSNYIRRLIGSEEFIHNSERYCIWLKGTSPAVLQRLPHILARVERVKESRLKSTRATTRALADTPMLFGEIRQPETDYLLFPRVSSEHRHYIPIGFLPKEVIAADSCLLVPSATLYHFGVLTSAMHMAWTRTVCGRLKSDYRYSATIVYNNFPWPQNTTDKQKETPCSTFKISG